MEESRLDITTLKKSVAALGKTIAAYNANISNADTGVTDGLRSGVIQNFEVAYELSWKFMKKWLEMNVVADNVIGISRRDFFRIAAENGLVTDVKKWWDFHDARNKTSHTYSETTAVNVFHAANDFLEIAKEFIMAMERKI